MYNVCIMYVQCMYNVIWYVHMFDTYTEVVMRIHMAINIVLIQ